MKAIRQSAISVIFPVIVHAIMCAVYNMTYYSTDFNFNSRFTGVLYWVLLICAFLAGPFVYYAAGRFRKGKGNKKAVLIILLALNCVLAVFGIVAMFMPNFADTYRIINAPSYMYYHLFYDSVLYLSIPAMLITSLFPVFFFKLGYTKKPRTENGVKMNEKNKTDG